VGQMLKVYGVCYRTYLFGAVKAVIGGGSCSMDLGARWKGPDLFWSRRPRSCIKRRNDVEGSGRGLNADGTRHIGTVPT
jgi:hypothetical protein